MRKLLFVLSIGLFLMGLGTAETPRNFSIDDALALKNVSDPRVSPDGKWIAYVVRSIDLEEDSSSSDIYMVPFEGGEPIAMTRSTESDSSPRWSPDGRYLGFLSSRGEDKSQIWLLDRRGGEPFQLSSVKGGVNTFSWSPDGKRIVLVSKDPDPNEDKAEGEDKEKKTKPPVVVTRLQFKRDRIGYLDDRRTHIYVLDVESKEEEPITSGPYDDSSPVWSPDGEQIAFVSNRTEEPDSNDNTDIFVVSSEGGEPRQLTKNPGTDRSPAWSPDGTTITYVSSIKPELIWYATNHLAVVDVASGREKVLTESLDRNVAGPRFCSEGTTIFFVLEDSGNQHLARIPVAGGDIERIVPGDRTVRGYHLGPDRKTALLISEPHLPFEVFALAGTGEPKQVTTTNQALLSEVRLGEAENIHFKSKDGTEVEGFVTKPPDFVQGKRYPTILRIHGGPVSQFSHQFSEEWQVFAGAGYVVVAANPRGSSGYGEDFSKALFADWGNKDFQDVMAAVDHAIELGYTDADKLGVGGWSYGGILTNYVITQTDRFKAAVSGASETNYLACYGTDHYQHEWEKELGLPWENRELYLKLSPITRVDKIVTPTLIMCGELDWNVPLNQSEQLYQSLRRLGRDTMLVIYPGQSHGIRKPTYQKDRYERYLEWYGRLLKGETKATTNP
jgi:dipeptidyl aminopeptidase/acylaminoacyl peptidase